MILFDLFQQIHCSIEERYFVNDNLQTEIFSLPV